MDDDNLSRGRGKDGDSSTATTNTNDDEEASVSLRSKTAPAWKQKLAFKLLKPAKKSFPDGKFIHPMSTRYGLQIWLI